MHCNVTQEVPSSSRECQCMSTPTSWGVVEGRCSKFWWSISTSEVKPPVPWKYFQEFPIFRIKSGKCDEKIARMRRILGSYLRLAKCWKQRGMLDCHFSSQRIARKFENKFSDPTSLANIIDMKLCFFFCNFTILFVKWLPPHSLKWRKIIWLNRIIFWTPHSLSSWSGNPIILA